MVIIFLHIPKTGGNTLLDILLRYWNAEETVVYASLNSSGLSLLKEKARGKKLITGHFKYGFHSFIGVKEYAYITLLRDPVSRVISEYYYLRESPQELRSYADMDIQKWIFENKKWVSNLQTRFLSGEDNVSLKSLEKAKRNLRREFLWVGITEMFDESLLILKKTLGLKDVYYGSPRNVTLLKPEGDKASESELFWEIRKLNVYDIELYEYAKELLDERIIEYGSDFKIDFERFKRENKGWKGRYAHALDTYLREVRRGKALALFRTAQVFAMEGYEEEALRLCDEAKEISWCFGLVPVDFLYLEAGVYRILGRHSEAEAIYALIAENERNDAPLRGKSFYYLGEIYLEKGRIEEAIEAFKKCLELYPGHAKAYLRFKELMKVKRS